MECKAMPMLEIEHEVEGVFRSIINCNFKNNV